MKALMTLVLALLLVGCAAGQGGAGRTPAEETTAHNAGKEESTLLRGEGNLPRPPDSTLSYGGQEVKGVLGSHCWGNMCADSVFIVPPHKKTLTVPSGSEVVFRYGGQDSAYKVAGARAYPLSKNGTSTASADSNRSRSLKTYGSGVERTIPVELPPGEYVVDVFIREPKATRGYNDAVYYFRVMVE